MKRIVCSIIILIGYWSVCNAQTYHQLSWNEFIRECLGCDNSMRSAESSIMISSYPHQRNGDTCTISIYALFLAKESWVKKSSKTDWLLNHEQRHYDIFEIGARIQRKIMLLENFSTFVEFYDRVLFLTDSLTANFLIPTTNLYDKETNHSINEEEQLRWNEKIQLGLDTLEAYKDEKIIKIIPKLSPKK